jgi:hypothetical protein
MQRNSTLNRDSVHRAEITLFVISEQLSNN